MAKQTYDGGRRQNEELGVDEPNKDIDKTAIHERSPHVNQRDALQSSSIVNEIVDTPPHAQQRRVFPPGRAALPWLSAHPRRSSQDLQTPTLAPKKYEGASMTDPQQIPGSYISEDDHQQPPLANGRSSPTESYSSALSIPSSQKTVIQEHGLREKSSQNTITSTTSTRPIHHLLLATNTHQSRLGNAAKPVSTPRTEELGSCVALPRTVVLGVQRPIDEATSEGSVHDHVTALPFHTDGESSATKKGKIVNATVNPSSTQLSHLLAHLPLKEDINETTRVAKSEQREKSSSTADTDGNQTDRDKLENRPKTPNASSANTSIGGDRHSSKSQALSSTTSNSSKNKPDHSPVSPRSHRLTLKEELGCQYNSSSMVSVANSDSTSQTVNVASRQMLHQTPSVESRNPTLTTRPSNQHNHPSDHRSKVTMPTMNEIAALMDKDTRTRKHGTDNADVLSSSSRDQRNAESFTQIIYNLEGLLREALKMAQEATKKRDFAESRARKLEHEFVGAEKAGGLQIRLGSIPPPSMPTYLNSRSDYGGTVGNPSLEMATLSQGNGVAMAPNLINQDAQFVPKTEPQTSQNGKHANNSVKTGDESSGWNVAWKHRPKPSANRQPSRPAPLAPRLPETIQVPSQERRIFVSREVKQSSQLASREDVRQHIQTRHEPPIQPRLSSLRLRGQQSAMERPKPVDVEKQHSPDSDYHIDPEKDFEPIQPGYRQSTAVPVRQSSSQMQDFGQGKENDDRNSGRHSHFIIRDHHHFSLSRSHR